MIEGARVLIAEDNVLVGEMLVEVLGALSSLDTIRQQVLFRLLCAPLSPEVEALLRDFVRDGSKAEASQYMSENAMK